MQELAADVYPSFSNLPDERYPQFALNAFEVIPEVHHLAVLGDADVLDPVALWLGSQWTRASVRWASGRVALP